MEHTHIVLPSICTFQGRDQERHQAQPPLRTGYGCCICMRRKNMCELDILLMHAHYTHTYNICTHAHTRLQSKECHVINTDFIFSSYITATFTLSHYPFKDPLNWNDSRYSSCMDTWSQHFWVSFVWKRLHNQETLCITLLMFVHV